MKSFLCILLCLAFVCHGHGEEPTLLRVVEKEVTVNGQKASVFGLVQPDGTVGLTAKKGEAFNVTLVNRLKVPTSIHWHGLILPNRQDGVAFITQYPLYPQTHYHYEFPLIQAGTFFMHSHYGLQEQKLLAAPLILHDEEENGVADQEVVVLLSDFSFKSPSQIYRELRCKKEMSSAKKMDRPDVVEVKYDAFLANFQTLDNPPIFPVKPGSRVRMRLINSASATNFWVDLEALEGEAIAVDGNRIQPLHGKVFELGIAQRIDILVTIPKDGGTFPIFAKGEDTMMQTGFLLSTTEPLAPSLSMLTSEKAEIIVNKQESLLHALHPLEPKAVDQQVLLELGGDMQEYVWTINGQSWPEVTPIVVEKGERVEMTFKNATSMTHPMHLHGHVFQITAINGKAIDGAMRDTVLVPPNSSLTIQFDANNPGIWPLHCHLLYHLEAGMLTVVKYQDFIQPL